MTDSKNIRIGFALCGSFCTFEKAISVMEELSGLNYDITPIMSFNAYTMDTRFGTAKSFIKRIEDISKKEIINTIESAEPAGPNKMFDIILVAPCTGNTLAKLACSITDTPVTMAVKSHLRNKRPVLLAISTNDALSGTAKNIGQLLNYKSYYFVPSKQDDAEKKPASLVADFSKINAALTRALKGEQIQPMLI